MSTAALPRVDGARTRMETPRSPRLRGIDLARTAAILGMVVTHLIARYADDPWGSVGWVFAGRASALFAVLAGLSIAMTSGRHTPVTGTALRRARIGLAVRALLIYLIGLVLDPLDSGIAVILPAYGAMFLLAVPFLHLGFRSLATWAVGWCLLGPWVGAPLRAWVGDPDSVVHSVPDHGGWLATTELLTLTGYYPVVFWFGYVLAGMALGRLDLTRWSVQRGITLAGLVLATAAWGLSRFVTSLSFVRQRLLSSWRGEPVTDVHGLDLQARMGLHGQAPPEWAWQFTTYPHGSTMLDLLHTIGTSFVVIGACLVLVSWLPRATTLWGVVGSVGAVSLTSYTVHILLRTYYEGSGDHGLEVFAVHLTVMYAVALVAWLLGRRGPLEAFISRTAKGAAQLSTRP